MERYQDTLAQGASSRPVKRSAPAEENKTPAKRRKLTGMIHGGARNPWTAAVSSLLSLMNREYTCTPVHAGSLAIDMGLLCLVWSD